MTTTRGGVRIPNSVLASLAGARGLCSLMDKMEKPMRGFTEADVPDQSGKTFIVTGANTGIGFEVARVLGERSARVLLACRDAARAGTAIARIQQATPRAELAFLPLDL